MNASVWIKENGFSFYLPDKIVEIASTAASVTNKFQWENSELFFHSFHRLIIGKVLTTFSGRFQATSERERERKKRCETEQFTESKCMHHQVNCLECTEKASGLTFTGVNLFPCIQQTYILSTHIMCNNIEIHIC